MKQCNIINIVFLKYLFFCILIFSFSHMMFWCSKARVHLSILVSYSWCISIFYIVQKKVILCKVCTNFQKTLSKMGRIVCSKLIHTKLNHQIDILKTHFLKLTFTHCGANKNTFIISPYTIKIENWVVYNFCLCDLVEKHR